MKKLYKVGLWIIGIAVTLIVVGLLSINAFHEFIGDIEEVQKEGFAFAATATKEECLAETAGRLAKCETTLCMEPLNFGSVCVFNAQGSREEFCTNKPKSEDEFSTGTWQQHCATSGLERHECESLLKVIVQYCG